MAFDYGSQSLGITNPFKTEGKIKLLSGILISALALLPLFGVAETLKHNPVKAWGMVFLGLFLLTWGLRTLASAAIQLFRFYVGRSVPSSLAYNYAQSERENAELEKKSGALAYSAERLESMLMGRKNMTFSEPTGWLSRLVHSLIPGLILTPYPLRNLVQELAAVLSSTLVGLTAFALAFFVTATGLAGSAGELINTIMSLLLLVYLTFIWRSAANNMNTGRNQSLHRKTAAGLSRLFAFAIVVPVLIGYCHSQLTANLSGKNLDKLSASLDNLMVFDAWLNLMLLLVMTAAVLIPAFLLVRERMTLNNRSTAVSEYRDNMQEAVHPNEIFINIENIVLANRRSHDIPNRIYRDFEPQLQEQSQGKGTFKGQLLIETQPEFRAMNFSKRFTRLRLLSTISGQLLTVGSAVLLYVLFNQGFESAAALKAFFAAHPGGLKDSTVLELSTLIGAEASTFLTLLFAFFAVVFAARMLSNVAHTFWSEMQFSSLLMSMKTEGTYTESKISTGMAYNDSTRSENVVVRSSITPWILVSRIESSTYATSGMQNLEMPRLILGMTEDKQEMDAIVGEIHGFLRGREFIASINNEKDLANAERIYQVNRISKSDDGDMRTLAAPEEEEVAALTASQDADDNRQ